MTHPKREDEEHSLQLSVHFDIDINLHQTRRKRPHTPAIHNGYITIITHTQKIIPPKQQF